VFRLSWTTDSAGRHLLEGDTCARSLNESSKGAMVLVRPTNIDAPIIRYVSKHEVQQ